MHKIKATNRERIKQNIRHKTTQRARIPQRHRMQLRTEQRERAQLIYDKASGDYLKYRQLMRDPKYKETWSQSAANEFGRLAQGVGGRFKGTNTIFFVHKKGIVHSCHPFSVAISIAYFIIDTLISCGVLSGIL